MVMVLLAATSACNRDEIFEREQYKHVVSLLSEGAFNIFSEEHDLADDPSTGYVAASCGGALTITEPVTIHLAIDSSLVDYYNNINFEMNADRYAQFLPPGRYTIENYRITIPDKERSGKTKIQVRGNGLSPDSIYFIPLRITHANSEINPEKSTVLYRVYMKNFYATNKSVVAYQQRSIRTDASGANVNNMMTKEVFPASGNSVRIFAGNQAFESKENMIANWSVRLTVAEDGHVAITPWDNSAAGMKLRQIDDDPEYPNIFKIVDDGYRTFKTFLLCYEYTTPVDGPVYTMKEELRFEFKEEQKN
jgi:hypothetical protein